MNIHAKFGSNGVSEKKIEMWKVYSQSDSNSSYDPSGG
jgi:hypothetical protein